MQHACRIEKVGAFGFGTSDLPSASRNEPNGLAACDQLTREDIGDGAPSAEDYMFHMPQSIAGVVLDKVEDVRAWQTKRRPVLRLSGVRRV